MPNMTTAGNRTTSAHGPAAKQGLQVFISAEVTGTGAPQSIAHGFTNTQGGGVVPQAGMILFAPTDLDVAVVGEYTIVEGTHTATNIVVTATLNKLFKVIAFAPG